MARVKRGVNVKRRHKKILKLARGYFGAKSKLYRPANEQVMKSLSYAYAHRKKKKGDFRRLWIQRINAAARINGLSYNRFMCGLRNSGVIINRKILADLAIHDSDGFAKLVILAKDNFKAKA